MQRLPKKAVKTNGLVKKFSNTYQFCNRGINKFVLLLKGVYPYEDMDSWERFHDKLPQKSFFQ